MGPGEENDSDSSEGPSLGPLSAVPGRQLTVLYSYHTHVQLQCYNGTCVSHTTFQLHS